MFKLIHLFNQPIIFFNPKMLLFLVLSVHLDQVLAYVLELEIKQLLDKFLFYLSLILIQKVYYQKKFKDLSAFYLESLFYLQLHSLSLVFFMNMK